MATRFRLTSSDTDPAVTPATESYTHTRGGTRQYRQLLTIDASALANESYTPDAADHLVAGDAHYTSFVSSTLETGTTFTNGDTIKCAMQATEAVSSNNLRTQIWVGVYDSAGTTLRRALRSKVGSAGTELAGTMTNRFLSTTQDGATYTTVAGDILVVEVSLVGTPTAAGGTQGHNGNIRFGGNGAGGDLPENDTDAGTTLNPWIEFVPNMFATDATPTPAVVSRSVTVPQVTQQAGVSLTPATVETSTTAPQASANASSSITPTTIAVVVTTPQASPQAGVSVTPAVIARAFIAPQTITQAAASVTPATIARAVMAPQVTLQAASSVTPASVTWSFGVPQATVELSANAVVGQATETDQAQPVSISKVVVLGQATETDSALALARNVGQATELDIATPLETIMGTVGTGIIRSPNRVRIYAAHNEVT